MKRIIIFCVTALLVLTFCITAGAASENDLILSNCDSTLNWSANSQGMDALESDTVNKTEGSGSVGATAINGKLNQLAYILENAIDISEYAYLEFDIYFSDITWFNDCGSVMFELTSSGTSDKESNRYMKKVMRNLFETAPITGKANWWHFVLEVDNPQGTANGGLNKTSFNFMRFYSVDPITTTPDYTMRIDNIRFTNNPSDYTPLEEDSSGTSPAAAEAQEKATVYVPKRSDPNAALTQRLQSVLKIEYTVLAAVCVLFAAALTWFIVKKVKSGKGGN